MEIPLPATAPNDGAVVEALLDLVNDPIWMVDDSGKIVRQNAAHARWQIAAASLGEDLERIGRRASSGRPAVDEVHLTIGGAERAFAIHASCVIGGGVLFLARDIGEHVRLSPDEAIERTLLRMFSSEVPLRQILPNALEFLCISGGWDAAILWRQAGEVLRPEAWWVDEQALAIHDRIGSFTVPRGHGAPGRAAAAREIIWIADILEESTLERDDFSAVAGLRSIVAVPMHDSGDVVGVLELFTRAVHPINDRKKFELVRTGEALGRLMATHAADEERRRLLHLVERKGAEWMLTFDSIALPIFLVTSEGVIVRLNRAACHLTGSRFDDVLGRRLRQLGAGEPWKTLGDITDAVRDSAMACTAQITDGQHAWDVSATLLAATPAEERRVIIVLHDMTQLIALQESVRRGEQLAALGELVAGVAHEVKNPIFGMSATLDLLERTQRDAESVELLASMRAWLGRLSTLTENLLEYGRTWNVELHPGTIERYVEQAIDTCRPHADKVHLTIERQGSSGGAAVLMDENRIVHVFENLLVNAIQFSPPGERVTITLSADEKFVGFSVHDRGPGFRSDDLPRLCQPFFTRRRGGSGLGLAIVQRIMDEHGGIIDARNAAEGGAVVEVRFPKFAGQA